MGDHHQGVDSNYEPEKIISGIQILFEQGKWYFDGFHPGFLSFY